MKKTHLALRPYLEKIEQHCRSLDHESLVQLHLDLAKQVDAQKRDDYLRSLLALRSKNENSSDQTEKKLEKLIHDIEDLGVEILARIESIEDGSYWDDPDDEDWEEYYYNDDEPDFLNENQKVKLVDYFSEAAHYFVQGDKASAVKLYSALFTVIDKIGEDSTLMSCGINLPEARARFARCVYEFSSPEKRADDMLKVMNVIPFEDDFGSYFFKDLPLLQDIIDADSSVLDDFDIFLKSWRLALTQYDYKQDRIADLLLEASYMVEGLTAVSKLANKWQAKQPKGYLFWLEKLEGEKEWQTLAETAKEALTALPAGRERFTAADYLITAGEKLKEDKVILTGHRDRFVSLPREESLLALLAEAGRQQLRDSELEQVCNFFSERKLEYGERTLYAKALLMAGKFEQAFDFCKTDKPVGWSSDSPIGLVFASSVFLLSGGDKGCTTIFKLLHYYSDSDTIYFDSYDDYPPKSDNSTVEEIVYGLKKVDTAKLDLPAYQKWAMEIGQKRINHIVSNKYRNAYARAALVLASLAEVFVTKEEKEQAQTLLHDYCRVHYNRFRAFRQEARVVVGGSGMLADMVEGL